MRRCVVHSMRRELIEAFETACDEAGSQLSTIREPATGSDTIVNVVVDLTHPGGGDAWKAVTGFFSELEDSSTRVRLTAIGEGTIPLPLVESLELLEARHVDVSDLSNEDVHSIVRQRGAGTAFPARRSFASERVSVTTYDERLYEVVDQVRRVARHDVTLLIIGETGTGKTTLARLLHDCSSRREQPFQHIACGALPPEIIESELFGHVRGAFTGADRRKRGRFAAAGEGTLLLDEVDVLENKQQAMLLRVIETGEYEPVGSTETEQFRARLIVASNVDLESLTESNKFRADLYFRLNVLEVRLPPLRERTKDVVPLTMGFVRETSAEHGVSIEHVQQEFLERIREYPWPGNLRELKNHVQRAVLFSDDGVLSIDSLSPKVAMWESDEDAASEPQTLAARVASTERALLEEALRKHNYLRAPTAKSLGISRVGLYKKMRRLGMLETSGNGR